jgi:hypothetical protein
VTRLKGTVHSAHAPLFAETGVPRGSMDAASGAEGQQQ